MSVVMIVAAALVGSLTGGVVGVMMAPQGDDLGFGEALYGLAGCATGAVIGAGVGAVLFA